MPCLIAEQLCGVMEQSPCTVMQSHVSMVAMSVCLLGLQVPWYSCPCVIVTVLREHPLG
jgi:hypothetical protein